MTRVCIGMLGLLAMSGCSDDGSGVEESADPSSGASGAGATSGAPANDQNAGAGASATSGAGGLADPAGQAGTSGAAGSPGSETTDAGPGGAPETISLDVDPELEGLYEDADKWLCLPGMNDELCTSELDATIVRADGTTEVEAHAVASDPGFDCFYVYPTVSNDTGSNADFSPDSQETNVVRAQAARYTRECRLFAPLYRQITLTALNGGGISDDARVLAYGDVRASFNHYLTRYNEGRGFVLIGHSQGAGMLTRLIADEIDGRPELRARLIAAHLLGTSVAIPEGADVGGAFQNVPVCRSDSQFGCVLAYVTFRDRTPPPDTSRFGRVESGRAVCANPGALAGGSAVLTPYFLNTEPAFADGMRVSTPFVTFPEFIQTECVDQGEFTYLELTVLGDPQDPRTNDIGGDLTPDWGMHLVDVHIAMGTLVDLAGQQAAAFLAQP